MALSRRDRVGVFVLILLFVVFVLIMIWRAHPPFGSAKSPEDSVFVQQRLKNLQKGK